MASNKPLLAVKEISDLYIRNNFQALREYFDTENQLLNFKFFDISFDVGETNRKLFHGIGLVPADLIRLAMTGTGKVTFDRSLFDKNYLFITADGPCRVRFFAGNYFGAASLGNFDSLETEEWSATISSSTSSSSSSTSTSSDLPSGSILLWPGLTTTIPSTFLLLDGSLKNTFDYPAIYAVLGARYNTGGESSAQFRLPNVMGRMPVFAGVGSGLTSRVLAASGGEETHLLVTAEMPVHTHTQDAHVHNIRASGLTGQIQAGSFSCIQSTETLKASTLIQSTVATNQNTGGDTAHNNMPPYIVFYGIIKI